MSAPCLICIVKNNEYKVAQIVLYNGFPEIHGIGVLDFLTKTMKRDIFEKKVANLSFATSNEIKHAWESVGVDPKSLHICLGNQKGGIEYDKSNRLIKQYPEFSEEIGSDILGLIQDSEKPLKLINNLNFAADSLYCRWVYVVDFDKNTFEVYKGLNISKLDKNERFYGFGFKGGFYPVRHFVSFNLDSLPTSEQFLNACRSDDEELI